MAADIRKLHSLWNYKLNYQFPIETTGFQLICFVRDVNFALQNLLSDLSGKMSDLRTRAILQQMPVFYNVISPAL